VRKYCVELYLKIFSLIFRLSEIFIELRNNGSQRLLAVFGVDSLFFCTPACQNLILVVGGIFKSTSYRPLKRQQL
jgi:hypothetical protein